MIQDVNRKHVEAFGGLNTDYSQGDFAYGVPEPGIILIDHEAAIQAKFSEENFRIRPDWADVLEAARRITNKKAKSPDKSGLFDLVPAPRVELGTY